MMTPYEQRLLQDLLDCFANGAVVWDTQIALWSEALEEHVRHRVPCWLRNGNKGYALRRPLETDLPNCDLRALENLVDEIEKGKRLTHMDAAELDPQLWLHLVEYVPRWRSPGQGPTGPDEYYSTQAFSDACLLLSRPTR